MPGGQDEPVARQPGRVGRVVGEEVLEDQVGGRSQAHGGAGVTVSDLLHCIGGENPNGVDRPLVELAPRVVAEVVGGGSECRHDT